MKRMILAIILIGILFVAGCSKEIKEEPTTEGTTEEETQDLCPDCDDGNSCTEDICNEGTDYQCAYKVIAPCCGNNRCESTESNENCPNDCKKVVLSEKLQTIVSNQQKIKSYRYSIYGNTVADRIYVKDDKIRYDLATDKRKEHNYEYDTVFLDKTKKEAYLMCTDLSCKTRNVPVKASYNEFIMEMPMEMIVGVTYKGDILQTEMCDTSKPCNKVEVTYSDGKTGFLWLDNFYGFPYRIEKEGKLQEFVTVAVNAVKDTDVTLP